MLGGASKEMWYETCFLGLCLSVWNLRLVLWEPALGLDYDKLLVNGDVYVVRSMDVKVIFQWLFRFLSIGGTDTCQFSLIIVHCTLTPRTKC